MNTAQIKKFFDLYKDMKSKLVKNMRVPLIFSIYDDYPSVKENFQDKQDCYAPMTTYERNSCLSHNADIDFENFKKWVRDTFHSVNYSLGRFAYWSANVK